MEWNEEPPVIDAEPPPPQLLPYDEAEAVTVRVVRQDKKDDQDVIQELRKRCKGLSSRLRRQRLASQAALAKAASATRRLAKAKGEAEFHKVFTPAGIKAFVDLRKRSAHYPEQLRPIAAKLYFYSPKAYKLLRQYLHLPSPSTIKGWIRHYNGDPGISATSIKKVGEISDSGCRD